MRKKLRERSPPSSSPHPQSIQILINTHKTAQLTIDANIINNHGTYKANSTQIHRRQGKHTHLNTLINSNSSGTNIDSVCYPVWFVWFCLLRWREQQQDATVFFGIFKWSATFRVFSIFLANFWKSPKSSITNQNILNHVITGSS